MPASALLLDAITRRHADSSRPALDALTLAVAAGELVALVGASGAGKSTTLRIVAGYEMPDAGRVMLDGDDLARTPPERRGFGMAFQHHALFPHLTVGENVAFGLAARGWSREAQRDRVRAALADVGLADASARDVETLSGGERQRVALARALVIEPRVLLLDEPLSSLDPTLRVAMRDELRATIRRSGVTTLFVTHDQDDAFAVADRVALLHDGRLLQVGTPESLYDAPSSRYVAEFIGRATLVPARRDGTDALVTIGGVTRRLAIRLLSQEAHDGDALAVLRPESLGLASAEDEDAWPGRVVARRFAAGSAVCHVELARGVIVEVHTGDRALRENDGVAVRVSRPVALVAAGTDR